MAALLLIVKLKAEEALLTRQFPDAYPLYQRRVKAIIPFLYRFAESPDRSATAATRNRRSALALLTQADSRYPDDVLLSILLGHDDEHLRAGTLWALEHAMNRHGADA